MERHVAIAFSSWVLAPAIRTLSFPKLSREEQSGHRSHEMVIRSALNELQNPDEPIWQRISMRKGKMGPCFNKQSRINLKTAVATIQTSSIPKVGRRNPVCHLNAFSKGL